MKHFKTISYLTGIVISMSSCYTTHLVDDDVYSMKDANVQIGETLTDETSYATFKDRTHKNERVNSYYTSRERFDMDPTWNQWNNYFFLNRFYRSSFGFLFDPFYRNNIGGFNYFTHNNSGFFNGSYGSAYGFYGNNSNFYNQNNSYMNNGYYGGTNYFNGNPGIFANSNIIVGPRGTMSGISNSSSLGNQMMLKSSHSNRINSNNHPNNTTFVSSKDKNERSASGREILTPVDKTTNRTATSSRTVGRENNVGTYNSREQHSLERNGNSGNRQNNSTSPGRSSSGNQNANPSRSNGNNQNASPSRSNGNVGPRRN
jgi:hypothetical protein